MKKYIAAYGSASVISLIGLVIGLLYQNTVLITVLAVASILPIFLFLGNFILARRYSAKLRGAKVAEVNRYMIQHRADAEKNAPLLLRKLQKMRRSAVIYAVIVWILGACQALLGGMLYKVSGNVSLYIGAFISGTVFYVVYSRIPKDEPLVLDDNTNVLRRDEYPIIYDVVSRAAQTLGCQGEITVIISFDCNAMIVGEKDKYYLQLGAILLNILSEEELYCICLHEFSHCSDRNGDKSYEAQYNAWLNSDKGLSPVMSFFSNVFIFFDVRYAFNYLMYKYTVSVVEETKADLDMAKHGTPEIAASALLKIDYDNRFRWEDGGKDFKSIYESDTPSSNFLSEYLSRFKDAIAARHGDWNEMLMREILPNNASHPILRMRFETLGIEKIAYVEREASKEYEIEAQRALEAADKSLCESHREDYEKERKEFYLDPLARINEWKSNGMPISAQSYADIITDLKSIGLNSEAEALCERAIEELDKNSSQHAYFIKGCALLCRYDESGIELIYHAVQTNHNYLEEGLEMIGTFCCITGREKELLEYRERAQVLAQKDIDEYSETCVLSKNDNLVHDDMPSEMLEEILSYIRSVDGGIIRSVYLVRKVVNDNFFTSAFVLQFDGGSDEVRDDVRHKIFRYLDTYPVDWHFSLFEYSECYNIKFDKIEGSLVYSRAQD